jgi:hypothetical protein
MQGKRKTCCICSKVFIPHRNVGDRQKICGCPSCRKSLKQINNEQWRRNNPDYDKNEYQRTRDWLDQHPGYLERYRQEHPEYVLKNRKTQKHRDRTQKLHLDIQAKLKRQPAEIIAQSPSFSSSSHLDIQAQFMLQPLEVTLLFSNLTRLSCLDIQAEMDLFRPLRENATITNGGGAHGCPMAH